MQELLKHGSTGDEEIGQPIEEIKCLLINPQIFPRLLTHHIKAMI